MFTVGNVGIKQCMHCFHILDCLLGISFYDYILKLAYGKHGLDWTSKTWTGLISKT